MLSNVLALLVAPEYSAAWGFARSFGHGVKGPGFALRGLFCDLTAGCKASSQGSLYLRCRGDAGTFSLLDNILRFAWPLYRHRLVHVSEKRKAGQPTGRALVEEASSGTPTVRARQL